MTLSEKQEAETEPIWKRLTVSAVSFGKAIIGNINMS